MNNYSHRIIGSYKINGNEEHESRGIYGIYEDDELVYIGSTIRSFNIRFKEHEIGIKTSSNELYLYTHINKNKNISFGVLLDLDSLKVDSEITLRDLESMELALISLYQPKYNLAGRTVDFRYK